MDNLEQEIETSFILDFQNLVTENNRIDSDLFVQHEVKRGLRDVSGRGVLVGLTRIGEVNGNKIDENRFVPVDGRLTYRGYDVKDLVAGIIPEQRFGFEEIAYLLLSGVLPSSPTLQSFQHLLGLRRQLSEIFIRDIILRIPGKDIMNTLSRSVLAMYLDDDKADDTSLGNVISQYIRLIGAFPALSIYAYQAFAHYHGKKSLHIHCPPPELGTAESLLYMLRADSKYSVREALILDLALLLHAEHGGGNNSSFITHVITSTGTDTYSAISAALGSLKGPKHGGANIKVTNMMDDLMSVVKDWQDEDEIQDYLNRVVNREAFDRAGMIYGVGHAVYSKSDPRAVLLKEQIAPLAEEKGLIDEFALYKKVEKLAPATIAKNRRMYKGVSVNVDFYSGFLYRMLGIPQELFTPLFAIARVVGWSAHRLEELANAGKIIRPAYRNVCEPQSYVPLIERNKNHLLAE